MAMRTTPNNMTIAQYNEQLKQKQIIINHDYQRTDKVWPTSAKSNLIDTILTGYPIPKLILSQQTDLDTRKTRIEVVDGQQRTAAIIEFLDNKYALSRGEFAGSRFDTLDNDKKHDFLDYQLSADVFTSAKDEDIREVFRRINSYQVPLNKQETRHATHQGEFKWYIRDLGVKYATSFVKMGIMTERQISRMADLEFLTDLVRVVKEGIRTSSPSALDNLYDSNDRSFPDRNDVDSRISYGLGQIIDLVAIHKTKIMTRENSYSLFAALLAAQFKTSIVASEIDESLRDRDFADQTAILTNLSALADALEGDEDGPYHLFVSASRRGTNTQKNRRTRFEWFFKALTGDQL